jgi:hypothetical protein
LIANDPVIYFMAASNCRQTTLSLGAFVTAMSAMGTTTNARLPPTGVKVPHGFEVFPACLGFALGTVAFNIALIFSGPSLFGVGNC